MRTVALYTDTTGFGGAEIQLLSLAERLDRRRFRPVVFYAPSPALTSFTERIRKLGIEHHAAPPGLSIRHPGGLLRFAATVRRLGVDVFHAHKTYPPACRFGLLAAILARCRVVLSTDQLRCPQIPPPRQRRLLRFLSGLMHGHIAVSTSLKGYLVDVLGFRPDRVSVIPNWVDPDVFNGAADPMHVRASLAIPERATVIGCIARFHEQKGHVDLISAAARLVGRYPELLFVLVGDGATRYDVEMRVAALGLAGHFRFLGLRGDVPDLLAAMDIVVLPSRYEGFPVSVLEAMASRRPVVATAVDGTIEAIEDGKTGVLVEPGDVGALSDGMELLIRRPELRGPMGIGARDRVLDHFAADRLVRSTERLYEASRG